MHQNIRVMASISLLNRINSVLRPVLKDRLIAEMLTDQDRVNIDFYGSWHVLRGVIKRIEDAGEKDPDKHTIQSLAVEYIHGEIGRNIQKYIESPHFPDVDKFGDEGKNVRQQYEEGLISADEYVARAIDILLGLS